MVKANSFTVNTQGTAEDFCRCTEVPSQPLLPDPGGPAALTVTSSWIYSGSPRHAWLVSATEASAVDLDLADGNSLAVFPQRLA